MWYSSALVRLRLCCYFSFKTDLVWCVCVVLFRVFLLAKLFSSLVVWLGYWPFGSKNIVQNLQTKKNSLVCGEFTDRFSLINSKFFFQRFIFVKLKFLCIKLVSFRNDRQKKVNNLPKIFGSKWLPYDTQFWADFRLDFRFLRFYNCQRRDAV